MELTTNPREGTSMNEVSGVYLRWHEGCWVDDGTTRLGEPGGGVEWLPPTVTVERDGDELAHDGLRPGEDETEAQPYTAAEDRALAVAGVAREQVTETVTPW